MKSSDLISTILLVSSQMLDGEVMGKLDERNLDGDSDYYRVLKKLLIRPRCKIFSSAWIQFGHRVCEGNVIICFLTKDGCPYTEECKDYYKAISIEIE